MRSFIVIAVLLAALASCSEDDSLQTSENNYVGHGVSFEASVADAFTTRTTYNHDGSFNEGDRMTVYRQYPDEDSADDYSDHCTYINTALTASGVTYGSRWEAADSMVWEYNRQAKFRAWSISNLAGVYSNGNGARYPDYCLSDWVTVPRPQPQVKLKLHHLGARIGFTAKAGNQLAGASVDTLRKDYATEEDYQKVMQAYRDMRTPIGVNMRAAEDWLYLNSSDVRPSFKGVDGRLYMITKPDTAGVAITLPKCTKLLVRLYDVNSGDSALSHNVESNSHIVSLSKFDNIPAEGLQLKAGMSVLFNVGYEYGAFKVDIDNSFSWTKQQTEEMEAADETTTPQVTREDYLWWVNAMNKAAENAMNDGNYIPEFHIKNEKEFIAFINIVNGTSAVTNADGSIDYLKYKRFVPANGTKERKLEDDSLTAPFDFYNTYEVPAGTNKQMKVILDGDLNMSDWNIAPINKFSGDFDGQKHTISGLNVRDSYLFADIYRGAVRNIKFVSTHTLGVASKVTSGNIAGISIAAPSIHSIAATINGSKVAGCIHTGTATGAMIGSATGSNTMMGCMETAAGITGGALVGNNASFAKSAFIDCFFDIDRSPKATATGSGAIYAYNDYIRGARSYVLKAINDNYVDMKYFAQLGSVQKMVYYGMAPWKAMNSAINSYNGSSAFDCTMSYSVNTTGYDNRYPTLK